MNMAESMHGDDFVPRSVGWKDKGSPGVADLVNRVSGR